MRLKELQTTDAGAASAIREAAALRINGHDKDSKRVSPCDIPLYIVANKYDCFKSQSSADRRCLMQVRTDRKEICFLLYCIPFSWIIFFRFSLRSTFLFIAAIKLY